MLNHLSNSSIFWTCIGVIVALVIAICAARFPLTENINKRNQICLISVLSCSLLILSVFFAYYIYNEYNTYIAFTTESTTSEDIDYTSSNNPITDYSYSDEPTTSCTDEEEATESAPKINIKNRYNDNNYLINGAFGQTMYYKGFFKYSVEDDEFVNFNKEQIDCNFNKVNLIFTNDTLGTLNHCSVQVVVPASTFDNGYKSACLYNNNDFENLNYVYFEDGLYRFEIMFDDSNYNEVYYSKYIHINESRTYYIEVSSDLEHI